MNIKSMFKQHDLTLRLFSKFSWLLSKYSQVGVSNQPTRLQNATQLRDAYK